MANTIKISGMSCMHCVMSVKKSLGNVPGLKTLDVKIGEATVEGDLEKAKAAIENAGYDVVSVQ